MANLSMTDLHYVQILQNRGAGAPPDQALMQHAIAPGMSESTVDSQRAKALAYWTANQAAFALLGYNAVVTDAINWLTNKQAYHHGGHNWAPADQ
jgi:hypothetical protein